MKRTIFPPRIRQVQQTQATAQSAFEVTTEDEFRSKIGAIAASGATGTIAIVAPMTVSSPFIIPDACTGLIIRASGKHAITAVGIVDTLFDVRASDVTIEFVYASRGASTTADYFRNFVKVGASVAYAPTILLCEFNTERLYLDEVGCNYPAFIDNRHIGGAVAESLACIEATGAGGAGFGGRVVGNYLSPGAESVKLTGTASGWMITGNSLGAVVDTASSAGSHRLAGNPGVYTHTLHASDYDADDGTRITFIEISDANYTAEIGNRLIAYDTLTATRTVTLPTATSFGERKLTIKDETGNASASVKITIVVSGGGTIDGAASKEITSAYGSVTLYATGNGGAWFTLIPTSSSSSSGGWTKVTKTATETRASTSTLADDAALKFTMAANTTYQFRIRAWFETNATPDFKYKLNGPAGTTRLTATFAHGQPGAAPSWRATATTFATTADNPVGASSSGSVLFDGVIENGATGGDLVFQWAQNTLDVANTSVLKGSYLEYAVVA